MAAKKDKMIPSEKERKRALKYATPAGTGRMWVTMGIAFIIFGIILLLIPIGLAISEASAQRYDPESIHTATLVFYLLGAFFGFCGCFCVIFGKLAVKAFAEILCKDEIQLYRVRDIAFKQNFYERLCRVGSIHLCSTDAMTPEIDIRRIKNPRDVKEVLSKTIEACRKANGIRTSEIIGDHGRFPEPDPHGMPPEPCHEHPHD